MGMFSELILRVNEFNLEMPKFINRTFVQNIVNITLNKNFDLQSGPTYENTVQTR